MVDRCFLRVSQDIKTRVKTDHYSNYGITLDG